MSTIISTTVVTTGAITTLAQSKPPLTTVFTQPSSCATRWYHFTPTEGGSQKFLMNYAPVSFSGRVNDNYFDACRPYSAQDATYSPGICPSGKAVGSIDFFSQGTTSVWRGLCCPSGWFDGDYCRTTFSTPSTGIVGYTESGSTYWDYTYVTSSSGSRETTSRKNTTVITSGTASAARVVVFWQSADLANFPSEYAASLATRIGVSLSATTTPSPGATENNPAPTSAGLIGNEPEEDSPGGSSSSLGTGAIAGIAVGSILGVIALIGAVFFILRRRRRTHRSEGVGNGMAEVDNNAQIQEMSGDSSGPNAHLMGKWRAEAQGDQPQAPVEIDSRGVKVVTRAPVEME